jgi:hypothetical protein
LDHCILTKSGNKKQDIKAELRLLAYVGRIICCAYRLVLLQDLDEAPRVNIFVMRRKAPPFLAG